uniref:N-acetyltransferase domain-containing protein n=1 Tax=Oncorhynchus tshawytscha TaxID=74940 RepID=A0AAZ3NWP4_ONCTS
MCLSLIVGPQDVHVTVRSHGTHTIILLRQQSDVLGEYRSRTPPSFRGEPVSSPVPAVVNEHRESEGRYLQVFSESEDSSDSSDDHEEGKEGKEPRSASAWETFCTGLEEFLARAQERRAQREAPGDEQQILPTAAGAESLIVGAAAYKLKTLSTGEKVLQLSLMVTRKRYRNCGVGRHIIELRKTQSVCGAYNAFLTHADTDAVDFFSCCGLTDDALLNDKFREVRDEWTNTTLMSNLPLSTTGELPTSLHHRVREP